MITHCYGSAFTIRWLQRPGSSRKGDMLCDEFSTSIIKLLAPLLDSLTEVTIYSFREVHAPLLNGVSQLSHLFLSLMPPTVIIHRSKPLEADAFKSVCGAIHRSSDTLQSLNLRIPNWEPSSSPIPELLNGADSLSYPKLAKLFIEIYNGNLERTLDCTPFLSASHRFSSLRALQHLAGRLSRDPANMPQNITTYSQF
jgi:hypothetical protein